MEKKKICFKVDLFDFVKNVKEMIIKEYNLDNEGLIILHHNGNILSDNESLNSYEIEDGDTLTFIERKVKTMKINIIDSKEKRISLDVESSDKISRVKEKIIQKINLYDQNIELIFNGLLLEDYYSIEYLGIKEGMSFSYLGQFMFEF